MKHIIIIVFCILSFSYLHATEQAPDILLYENNELFLATGWGHPSPLETYFIQNNITSPFKMISTANYRGFVAKWLISDNKLFITNINDTKTDINHLNEIFSDKSFNQMVFAEWFSGILIVTSEYFYSEKCDVYYYYIKKGIVQNFIKTDYNEINKIYKKASIGKILLTKKEAEKYTLFSMNYDYISYYFRLYEKDNIEHNGVVGKFIRKKGSSPILSYYQDDNLLWPYNWENDTQSGAPNCNWLVEKDELYLSKVSLFSGTEFKGPQVQNVPLKQLFPDLTKNNRVFAGWINGVFLILNGNDVDEEYYTRFETTEIILIEIMNGIIIKKFYLPGDFSLENPPNDCSDEIKQLLKKW